jgi:hypothetical protein
VEIVLAAGAAVVLVVLVLAWRTTRAPAAAESYGAAEDPGPAGLAGLTPGTIVRYRDERLVVERTLHFANDDERWVEHRLADDRLGRSLWLEIQEQEAFRLTVYERMPIGEEPVPLGELVRDGITFRLHERGVAQYRSLERAGPGKQGEVEFVEYEAGRVRLAYECFDDGHWDVSLGQIVEPDDVIIG